MPRTAAAQQLDADALATQTQVDDAAVRCDTMVVYRLQSSWDLPRGPHGKTTLSSNASKTAAKHRWALTQNDALNMNLHKCSWAPAEAVVVAKEPFMQIWSSDHAGSYTWKNPWNGSAPRIYDSRCLEHLEGGAQLWAAAMNPPCVAGSMVASSATNAALGGGSAPAFNRLASNNSASATNSTASNDSTATNNSAFNDSTATNNSASNDSTATNNSTSNDSTATNNSTSNGATAAQSLTGQLTDATASNEAPNSATAFRELSDDLPTQLAFTGSEPTVLAGAGITMMVAGVVAVRASRMEKIRLATIEARQAEVSD